MVQIAGYEGQVRWGTFSDVGDQMSPLSDILISDVDYRVHAWSLDVVGETGDITDFTSIGWREHKATVKGWSGSIEMYVDATKRRQPSDIGATAAGGVQFHLRLYMSSDICYHGPAIMTGWHPAVVTDGIETQTVDFQGTSDLKLSDMVA